MYRGCKGIEPTSTPGNKKTVSQGEIFEHMPEMTDGGGDLLSEEVVLGQSGEILYMYHMY